MSSEDNNGTSPDSVKKKIELRAAKIKQIYSQSLLGGFAALLGGLVFAGSVWNSVSRTIIIVWASCYVAQYVGRVVLVYRFRKVGPKGEQVLEWGKRHSLMTFSGNFFWAVAAFFMFPGDSLHLQIFMVIFVGGIVAGAVVVYSPTNEYLSSLLLAALPLAGRFFYEGGQHNVTVGALLLMFSSVMGFAGWSIHKLYTELLSLRFERGDLIEHLREEIFQRQQALQVTNRLRGEAEAASAAKSEFLTNMSHELRTPLNAILGFSELLEDQWSGKLNEKQAKYAREIFEAGQHLLQLINDILDLAKVESGKTDLKISHVDLAQMLDDCLTMIRQRAINRGLDLELAVSTILTGAVIRADKIKLKQIVVNLLSNAAKFTPSGGRIILKADRRGKELLISVTDTGIGIRREDQQRIFASFEQVDSSYSRQEQGTGLGLALCRSLVELHGGSIWVESEGIGTGSTFKFVIPFIAGDEGPVDTVRPGHASAGLTPESLRESLGGDSQLKFPVLVVEDNPANMKLAVSLLEAAGCQVLQAFNGEEGIKIAEAELPAVVLMDVSLPGMDGLTATRVLKGSPTTGHIPIVALTAHAMKEDETRARNAGCDAYLAKPVDAETLFLTLAELTKAGRDETIG